jgi:nucleotide-binding universal stress UspA family protein
MYTRIVVPLDGSELAESALPHGEALARLIGLPLHLVRVVDVVSTTGYPMADYGYSDNLILSARQGEETVADEYLAELADRYTDRNIPVTTERRTGRVTQELLATARSGDLYVMASHGRGGVSRLFLGSVAEEITRQSRAPVMIVRGDTDEQSHPVTSSLASGLRR